jgi:hypothetical protein
LEAVRDPTPDDTTPLGRAGFRLPLAILINPERAFALVSATREWVPAYLLVALFSAGAVLLSAGAFAHVVTSDPRSAANALTTGQQTAALLEVNLAWAVVGPLIVYGFVATLLAAASIGGERPAHAYARYFSLAMNTAIPTSIGDLITGIAVRFRDAGTFHTTVDVNTVLPISLAVFRPHGPAPEIAFLSYWTVFALWSLLLLGCGYAAISKMRLVPALLVALCINVVFSLVQIDGAT